MAKEIQLSRGKVALVDDEDYEWLSQWKWCFIKSRSGNGYAMRGYGPRKKRGYILMHRQILPPPEGYEIDHINRDKLDNRRNNLRIVTRSQNNANHPKSKNAHGKYKGTRKSPLCERWYASICVNYEHFYLGIYKTEEEAAHAYDAAAKKYFGEYARLNFPDE